MELVEEEAVEEVVEEVVEPVVEPVIEPVDEQRLKEKELARQLKARHCRPLLKLCMQMSTKDFNEDIDATSQTAMDDITNLVQEKLL